ncbi:DUF423 domain-containing protein [Blastopirellula sp. J2-11]|uniref:DUF423 domain-containing protein n=1 Tax=Blastopirellula sp. J2-11 TaxID=2943192 RepID=UPI0021C796D5|nr:DUF423 domain-containing protein [Blastopirellula sp. J2-11]UUO04739.1 DUF423 domain-containing protein [Blastopirellula sp. J2-11]
MSRYNLITGALFGLTAVLVGTVFESTVKTKLDEELSEKEFELPEELDADGNILKPKRSIISEMDRADIADRWKSYRDGCQYIMYHGFSMLFLGFIASRAAKTNILAKLGGACFTFGALFLGFGLAIAGIGDLPILAVMAPLGALAFCGGWICITILSIRADAT